MAAAYLRPTRLDDALKARARPEMRVAAGCTDLFPLTEARALEGPILDITTVADMRGLSWEEDALRIGAATTWSDVIGADLPPAFDGLKRAAREVGARQIQNRGTLGGNLCNASPAADGVPPLLTLGTVVELTSLRGKRRMPLEMFLRGPRQTALAPDEILTALLIPRIAGRGHFLKLGARKYLVISIAMVATLIVEEDGHIAEAYVAVGACSPVARRLPEVEQSLAGRPVTEARVDPDLVVAALAPINDVRADAAYRLEGAAELIARAVAESLSPRAVS